MRAQILVLALLVACKRDKDGDGAFGSLPDAEVTILEEGAGPENDAPLEPAIAGFRASSGEAWQRWVGPLDAGRDDVVAKDVSGGSQFGAPTIGSGVGLYRFTDDGLVVHALDAPLDDEVLPILMVPTTVRVGMMWESAYGTEDDAVNQMTVVRHQAVMLPTGPADAWAIAELADADGNVALTRWYAEGIGRIGTSGGETEWSPEFGYTEMILPLDAQDHAEPALEPHALSQTIAIGPHGNAGHEIFGFSGAVFDGVLYGYVDGEDPGIGYTPTQPHDLCARLDGSPAWFEGGAVPGCPLHTVPYQDPYNYLWYDVEVLVDNAAILLPGVDADVVLDGAGAVSDDTLYGWVADGVVRTLGTDFARYTWDTEFPLPLPMADGISTRGVFTSGDGSPRGQVWLGPAGSAVDATHHIAVIHTDGQVFRVTLTEGEVSGFVPVGILPGAVSVLLDGDERIAYSITTDGRLFEARVDQGTGEVAITGLGWVRVEEPGGAYEFKGAVLDPTHPGDVYVAAIATSATSVPAFQTGIFLAHLEAEPQPLVSAASLSVGAAEVDGGIAVCWAPSGEPFDGSGWTLRGESVDVTGPVGPNGNCAVIPFDANETVDPIWAGSERAIEATIPGVGPVRLGFPAGRYVGRGLFPSAAVRPDGLVVDVKGLTLGSDGFPLSYTYTRITSNTTEWPHDLGGYGLWTWPSTDTHYTEIYNIGGDLPAPTCPSTELWETCYYGGPVVGGGVLVMSPPPSTQIQVMRPDGTMEDIPTAQSDVRRGGILLEDGRMCVVQGFPKEILCTDAAGVTETTGPVPTTVQALNDQWWPLSDGSLLVCNTVESGTTLRFDPETMTVAELDSRALRSPVTSPDGHVYAVAHGIDGTSQVVEVTPEGVIDIAESTSNGVVLPIDGALLYIGPGGWMRIPR